MEIHENQVKIRERLYALAKEYVKQYEECQISPLGRKYYCMPGLEEAERALADFFGWDGWERDRGDKTSKMLIRIRLG